MTTAVSLKLTPANPPSAGKTELTLQENTTESESKYSYSLSLQFP